MAGCITITGQEASERCNPHRVRNTLTETTRRHRHQPSQYAEPLHCRPGAHPWQPQNGRETVGGQVGHTEDQGQRGVEGESKGEG